LKYSLKLTEEICNYIEAGNSQVDSAALSDISEKTFYEWMKTKSKFRESIKKAEYKCKQRNIAVIQRAAVGRKGKRTIKDKEGNVIREEEYDLDKPNWFAAAWWLERKFKEEFAQKINQDHTVRKTDKSEEEDVEERLAKLNEINSTKTD
jgi:hypothetical protein